ncbi:uncharacterized protein Dvar_84420 [Desulfosarcina variabilis str. Montpellier]
MNDHQRLALVYLKQNHDIDNQDYRRLHRVDMMTAGQDLQGLVQAGLLEQAGFGRWTKYRLKVSIAENGESTIGENEGKIISDRPTAQPIGCTTGPKLFHSSCRCWKQNGTIGTGDP